MMGDIVNCSKASSGFVYEITSLITELDCRCGECPSTSIETGSGVVSACIFRGFNYSLAAEVIVEDQNILITINVNPQLQIMEVKNFI